MTGKDLPEMVKMILSKHQLGVLATAGEDSSHASLISIIFTPDYSRLIFPTLRHTRKYANLCGNRQVAVLLDNRASAAGRENLYAVTISGSAQVIEKGEQSAYRGSFLNVHSNLSDFLVNPETVFVEISIEKVVLVDGVQSVREFLVS